MRKKRKYRIRKIGSEYQIEYWNPTREAYVFIKGDFPDLGTAEKWLDNLTVADCQSEAYREVA